MKHSRGGALPETVIVLGLTLTLLFGTFELGLIGYTQLSSDGAAFVAAHASVLGNDPSGAIAAPFPDVARNGGKVTISQSAADASDVPVDYQSGPTQQNNRHGGVQIVRPFHTQATVQQSGGVAKGVLGQFDLGGAFIEGNMLVSNTGYDLNGQLINDPNGRQNPYFSDDGNAPPYFIGFRYMWHCIAPVPTAGCQGATLAALGMAEYLDGSNWAQPGMGVGPNSVFAAMLLHQQVFAKILNGELPESVGGGAGGLNWTNTPCMRSVAAWDVDVPVGYPIGDKNIGYYPFHPLYNDPLC